MCVRSISPYFQSLYLPNPLVGAANYECQDYMRSSACCNCVGPVQPIYLYFEACILHEHLPIHHMNGFLNISPLVTKFQLSHFQQRMPQPCHMYGQHINNNNKKNGPLDAWN